MEKGQAQENNWSIKKHKKVEASKVITKDEFSSTFPVAGTKIVSLLASPNSNSN